MSQLFSVLFACTVMMVVVTGLCGLVWLHARLMFLASWQDVTVGGNGTSARWPSAYVTAIGAVMTVGASLPSSRTPQPILTVERARLRATWWRGVMMKALALTGVLFVSLIVVPFVVTGFGAR